MKKILLAVAIIFIFNPAYAQSNDPVVTNVTAQQRSGTKLVDITYDVSDADGDTLSISVQVSNDSGQTFTITPASLSGDVGYGIISGTGKSIVWDAGADYPNQYGTGFQVKVIAYDTKIINDGYGDYVLIPAGEFQMGDNFGEGNSDELPVHTVSLDAYYIGKYEVTNGEYKKFIDDGGYTTESYWTAGGFGSYSEPRYWNNSTYKGGGISGNENFPVFGVNWYESSAYCKWLSAKTSKTYRLPTEAEWEKAARGTDQRRYPWGYNIDGSYANYYNSGDPYSNLTPVGFYDGSVQGNFNTNDNKSPYGAYDMAGNVWEWCSDWYSSNYYLSFPENNPTGPSSGSFRVFRGGGWGSGAGSLRSAYRYYGFYPYYRDGYVGFRCSQDN